MIKRLDKSKKSKKGAILVIVVLILALAMIFIASAMMLTQATRRRLYSETMQSQARLTVTAASEAFLEALKTQEITDVQIENIVKNHASHSPEANRGKMVVDGVPGMSEDPANCTYIDIAKAKDYDTTKHVEVLFTTIIGDEKENIKVVLQEGGFNPTNGSRFSNQIEVNGSVGAAQLRFTQGVGMINPSYQTELDKYNKSLGLSKSNKWVYVDDNTILIRGNANDTTNDCVIFSDIVFADAMGNAKFGSKNTYRGRMVLLDQTYFTTDTHEANYYGDFYFVGKKSTQAGFKMTSANWGSPSNSFYGKNYIFSNRDVVDADKNTNNDAPSAVKNIVTHDGYKCYIVDSTGAVRSNFTATYKNNGNSEPFEVTNSASDLSKSYSTINDESKKAKEISHFIGVYRGYEYDTKKFPISAEKEVFNQINADGDTTPVSAGTKVVGIQYGKSGTVYEDGDEIPAGGDELIKNPIRAEHPSTATEITLEKLSKLDSDYSASDGTTKTDRIIGLPSGNYVIKGKQAVSNSTDFKEPYVICIDGSSAGSYRFWFEKNGEYYLDDVVFAVYFSKTDASISPQKAIFVLEEGADVYVNSDAQYAKNTYLCCSGFISVVRQAEVNNGAPSGAVLDKPKTIGQYIQSHTLGYEDVDWGGAFKTTKNTNISYSVYYKQKFNTATGKDESPKPAIYILGVKSNSFFVGPSAKVEAYIGLYGGNGHYDSPGKADNKTEIYGRIEANQIDVGYSTGNYCMPYCPAPGSSVSLPSVRPATSKYSVCELVYYYQEPTTGG